MLPCYLKMLSNLLRPPEPTPSLLVLKGPSLAATFKVENMSLSIYFLKMLTNLFDPLPLDTDLSENDSHTVMVTEVMSRGLYFSIFCVAF